MYPQRSRRKPFNIGKVKGFELGFHSRSYASIRGSKGFDWLNFFVPFVVGVLITLCLGGKYYRPWLIGIR